MHSGHHDHHRHPSKGASCVPASATGYALRQSRNAGFSSCLSRFLTLNVARHRVERMFGKLKQQRRIATRYDKTILSFESWLCCKHW